MFGRISAFQQMFDENGNWMDFKHHLEKLFCFFDPVIEELCLFGSAISLFGPRMMFPFFRNEALFKYVVR